MSEQGKNNKIELYMISQNINNETKTNSNISLDYVRGNSIPIKPNKESNKTPQKNPSGFLIKDPKTQQIFPE